MRKDVRECVGKYDNVGASKKLYLEYPLKLYGLRISHQFLGAFRIYNVC